MKIIRMIAVAAAVTIGFGLTAHAQSAPVRVFISNGVKTVIDEIRPEWEHAAGHPLAFEFGTTAALKQRIEKGEAFDVAVLTSEAIDDLIKDGKVSAGSREEVSRCGIGMGTQAGATKPDIRTPDALKRTLLDAKSVTFAEAGASRNYLDKMFGQFGISEQMKAKTVLTPSSVDSNKLVSAGKAQYILTLVSEILPAKGVELVGPLPSSVQSYVNFAAGAGAKSTNTDADQALLRFLSSAKAKAVFKAEGLEAR